MSQLCLSLKRKEIKREDVCAKLPLEVRCFVLFFIFQWLPCYKYALHMYILTILKFQVHTLYLP